MSARSVFSAADISRTELGLRSVGVSRDAIFKALASRADIVFSLRVRAFPWVGDFGLAGINTAGACLVPASLDLRQLERGGREQFLDRKLAVDQTLLE